MDTHWFAVAALVVSLSTLWISSMSFRLGVRKDYVRTLEVRVKDLEDEVKNLKGQVQALHGEKISLLERIARG